MAGPLISDIMRSPSRERERELEELAQKRAAFLERVAPWMPVAGAVREHAHYLDACYDDDDEDWAHAVMDVVEALRAAGYTVTAP